MNRPIKFRAWVPSIRTILTDFAIYPSGMIGIFPEHLEQQLNPLYIYDGETIHLKDDADPYEYLVTHSGEDWLWIEGKDYVLMQYTGLKDRDGKEIFEGDVLTYTVPTFGDEPNTPGEGMKYKEVVEWGSGGFVIEGYPVYVAIDFGCTVLGNIHEHPHLLQP